MGYRIASAFPTQQLSLYLDAAPPSLLTIGLTEPCVRPESESVSERLFWCTKGLGMSCLEPIPVGLRKKKKRRQKRGSRNRRKMVLGKPAVLCAMDPKFP